MFFNFLICTVAMVVSCFFFQILFYALNNSILRLFVPIKNRLSKLKYKSFFKWIIYAIFLGISVTIKESFNLSHFWLGIIIGFFYSLSHRLVGESVFSD
ncbi:hypothetical protein [Clostridium sp. SGI.024]|uniref:hypothetical protein n=1 Tax=Clostridium sp. SGI.024 TaxID=3420551 RepID=UPI003CFD6D97